MRLISLLLLHIFRYPLPQTIVLMGSLVFLSASLSACQSLPQSAFHLDEASVTQGETPSALNQNQLERERVSIASILDSPNPSMTPENQPQSRQSLQKSIVVLGIITQVAPFLTGVAYELTDETGKIWVVSANTDPSLLMTLDPSVSLDTRRFWVIGTPRYQSIAAGGQDWGEAYLQEQSRLQAK